MSAPVIEESSARADPALVVADRWERLRLPVISAMVALSVTAVLLWSFTGITPWDGARILFTGAFGGVDRTAETLMRSVPLVFVGVGAAVALRGGVFNVGGEGQMAIGALVTVLVITPIDTGPVVLVWIIGLLAGAAGGAAWAVFPAVLWAKRGVSEILSTLLLNFITISLMTWLLTRPPLQDPDPYVITAQGAKIEPALQFPVLVDGTRLHLGVILAVIATVIVTFGMRSPAGLRIDVLGSNPSLAAQAGMRPVVARSRLLLFSAAFAGLAGAVQLFGVSHRLTMGLTAGVGYTGVLVAVLGRGRPALTAIAALGFAALTTGGEALEREGAPRTVVVVVQAVLVVAVALAGRQTVPTRRSRRPIAPAGGTA
jgi:simple sugar transport system permease protein